jgi:hypothetical protein
VREQNFLYSFTSRLYEIASHVYVRFHPRIFTYDQVKALENAATVSVLVSRHTNIIGSCACAYVVRAGTGATAVASVNFQSASGTVVFATTQTSQTIQVTVYNVSGFSATDATFMVELSSPVNATLGSKATTVVSLQNIHPPAPGVPYQTGSTSTSVSVSWAAPHWVNAPDGAAGQVGFDSVLVEWCALSQLLAPTSCLNRSP